MSRRRFQDGDVVAYDEMIVRGHLTLEQYNEVLYEQCVEEMATAVRHYYVRCIPGPPDDEDEDVSYVYDWGDDPQDKRGCIKVTARAERERGKG